MATKNRKAFTLLELIMITSIVAIMLYIAIPRLKFDTLSGYKADTTARKIVTDLRRARGLALSDAASNSQGFQLAMVGSQPYTSYRITNRHTSTVVDSFTIDADVRVTSVSSSAYKFGPLGNMLSGGSAQITVTAQNRTFVITFVSATGTVKCVKS